MRGLVASSATCRSRSSAAARSCLLGALALCLSACASVPKKEYGVRQLDIDGMRGLDEQALKVCLVTQAREHFVLTPGAAGETECGVPPFDDGGLPIELWAWPWSDWPRYDEAVFDRDVSRVERWYKARGYYDAHVTKVTRTPDEREHKIDLAISVQENEPVLVERIDVFGIEALEPRLHARLLGASALRKNERFDEALYDESKRVMIAELREAAYAQASVVGTVNVDPRRHRAQVSFTLVLGRRFRFGHVTVEGQGSLPARPIWGAAEITEGGPYQPSVLEDAKRAVYDLGPFASVEIQEHPRLNEGLIDIVIKVVPGRRFRTGIGAGMLVGSDPTTLTPTDASGDSLVQWDLHLLGRLEYRNFLGGMRRISIEDRPRLIFGTRFPTAGDRSLGNLLTVNFRQPAFIEARTSFGTILRWDKGPDPFTGVFRSDLLASAGPERDFFAGKLRIASTININAFLPDSSKSNSSPYFAAYPKYFATYMQHSAVLDLRDAPREPHRGAYFGLSVQHAGYFLPSDWDYVRITPDVRAYFRLPFGFVLAARARVGIMEITSSDIPVDPAKDTYGVQQRLRDLGPLRQRLRGGGNNSVRGYAPNTLGDVTAFGNVIDSGGLRQWESSLELRAPITTSFGAVLFTDVGDVSRTKQFRFQFPQTTFGFGLRYRTIIGPLRLDVGFAPPSLQYIGDQRPVRQFIGDGGEVSPFHESTLFGARGAVHFTIGEAF
jgi:outer membrane protein assembly factor BamA